MIFTTYEVYKDEDDEKINEEQQECIICFENNINNEKIIKLTNQTVYFKNCQCSARIHNSCLKKWFYMNNSCPICRTTMIKKVNCCVYIIEKVFLYSIIITIKFIYLILIFIVLLFLYTVNINIYNYLNNKYSNSNNSIDYNNSYNNTPIYYITNNENIIII